MVTSCSRKAFEFPEIWSAQVSESAVCCFRVASTCGPRLRSVSHYRRFARRWLGEPPISHQNSAAYVSSDFPAALLALAIESSLYSHRKPECNFLAGRRAALHPGIKLLRKRVLSTFGAGGALSAKLNEIVNVTTLRTYRIGSEPIRSQAGNS